MQEKNTFSLVAKGSIHGPEAGGTVVLETSKRGSALRLEDYWVAQGAPDVRVYLTPSETGDVRTDGTIELGRLTSFSGRRLVYTVPAEAPLARMAAVVVYCKVYSVTFGVAVLEHV